MDRQSQVNKKRKLESEKCQISTECDHCKVYVPSGKNEAQFDCKICNVSVQVIVKPLDLKADENENETVRYFQEDFEFEDFKIEIKDEPIDVDHPPLVQVPASPEPSLADETTSETGEEMLAESTFDDSDDANGSVDEKDEVQALENCIEKAIKESSECRVVLDRNDVHNYIRNLQVASSGEDNSLVTALPESSPKLDKNLIKRPFGQANPFKYKCQVKDCGFRTRRTRLITHYMKQHNMKQSEAQKLIPRRLITTAKMDLVQCPKCDHKCTPLTLRRHIFHSHKNLGIEEIDSIFEEAVRGKPKSKVETTLENSPLFSKLDKDGRVQCKAPNCNMSASATNIAR